MSFGLKILIFNSGRLQISRYISLVATYPVVQAVGTICVQNRIDHGFCKNALTKEEADPQLRMRLKLLTEDNIYC